MLQSFKCAVALCLRNNVCVVRYFVVKKNADYELSAPHNLFVGGASCFDVDAYGLIRAVLSEGWDGGANFLK